MQQAGGIMQRLLSGLLLCVLAYMDTKPEENFSVIAGNQMHENSHEIRVPFLFGMSLTNMNFPAGTVISNREPFPSCPHSLIER